MTDTNFDNAEEFESGEEQSIDESAPEAASQKSGNLKQSKALRRAIAQSQALSQQMNAMQAQVSSAMEQQRQFYESQLQAARGEIGSLRQYEQSKAERERAEKLEGVDRFAYDLKNEVKKDLDGGLTTALNPIMEELRTLKAERAQERQYAEQQAQLNRGREEVSRVLSSKVFKDLDPADAAEIRELAEEQIMVASAAFGTGAEEAADRLLKFMQGYNKARYKAKQAKTVQQKPSRVPHSPITSASNQAGYRSADRVPLSDLQKQGLTIEGRPSRFAALLSKQGLR